MSTIDHLINNIKKLDIEESVKKTMQDNPDALTDAQRKQMIYGKRSGSHGVDKIGKYGGTVSYKRMKFNMNPLAGYGNVDLKLTGEFQRNIKVFFFSESFFLKSTDWKNDILIETYGGDIFGLSKQSKRSVSKTLSPYINQEIKKQLLK